MFQRFIRSAKSLFFPGTDPHQDQELATPSHPATGNSITSPCYPVDMVQTRRQSQSRESESVKRTGSTGTIERMPAPKKRAIGGINKLAPASRKRRKVTAMEEAAKSSEGVADSEMGDTITVLPDLPVRPKDSGEAVETTQELATSGTLEPEKTKTESKELLRPTHTRFASEEPEPQPAVAAAISPENPPKPVVEDDESGDDVPEAVTLQSGQEQARSREEEAAKALERQTVDAREKRKQRDAKLKEQAASSKRNKKRKFDDLGEGEASPAATDLVISIEPQHRPSRKSDLPALLPEDILLAVPATRPPTPPLQHKGQKPLQPLGKHKIFTEKPSKDVKRGPITVRVLESTNTVLAPKVVKATSSIRESWLVGRPGKNGHPSVERRKVGGGFLRR
ncbi:MAG: hypothetical protein M1839_000504 [Geoglossum umbratile]|nr:MAG: hypothetical protein M1839_000504 [Geoglossum umbratile]